VVERLEVEREGGRGGGTDEVEVGGDGGAG
jgi:hypothetical protein